MHWKWRKDCYTNLLHIATYKYDVEIAMTVGFQFSGNDPRRADDTTALAVSDFWGNQLTTFCR